MLQSNIIFLIRRSFASSVITERFKQVSKYQKARKNNLEKKNENTRSMKQHIQGDKGISYRPRAMKRDGVGNTRPMKQRIQGDMGINYRLRAMKQDEVDMSTGPDMDLLEDSEGDFYNIHKAHKQFEKETEIHDNLQQLRIVKQKYFKEQIPNFLTWSEKEQIRHLHSQDPEEWTPERIAESFPTTVDGVKKLIKVVWKPASQSRIDRHDTSALRNWKELKDGTLDLESGKSDVIKHILKFSTRTIPLRSKEALEETKSLTLNERKFGEFSSIVMQNDNSSQENEKVNSNDDAAQLLIQSSSESSIVSQENIKTKRPITLENLRSTITENINRNTGTSVSQEDKLIITPRFKSSIENANDKNPAVSLVHTERNNKPKSIEKVSSETLEDDMKHLDYPNIIMIPKKSYKKGATYKVNDCFYDDDGKFLYRVPGLTNNI